MTLQSQKPNNIYKCTQLELYAVCRIIWKSFLEKVAAFTPIKGYYTTAYGNERLQQVKDAQKLPSVQKRGERSETAGIELKEKGDECLAKWQFLRSYIEDSFAENLHKPKLEAAGWLLYTRAGHGNWEVLTGLLDAGETFISENTATLSVNTDGDPNMPDTFPGQFTALKGEYDELYDEFEDAQEDAEEQTTEKINANNDLHKITMKMAEDGQKIYRNDRATQERFIFEQVLDKVRGSRGVLRGFSVPPASSITIERIVNGSEFTNTGTVDLIICEGTSPCDPATGITVPPDDTALPPSDIITVTNNDSTTEGTCTARITID